MKIVISSGHGKYIRGASGYIDEVDEARKVVENVAGALRSMDVETITYHDNTSTSQSENLNRITDYHNSQKRDLDVSVHFNAYQTTSKPMGSEVLYVTQKDLAKTVVDKICSASGLINRGPKYRGDLAFLNKTNKPSVLIEVSFVDSKADVDIYHAKYGAICSAIAEGLSGRTADQPETTPPPIIEEPSPEPPEEVPPSKPPLALRPTLKKGDKGQDVMYLQKSLGIPSDGDFGNITETQVKAFQAAVKLSADGVVGPKTWEEIDYLDDRMANGYGGLSDATIESVTEAVENSKLVDFSWPDRGKAPPGYIPGMALCYALAVKWLNEGKSTAAAMAKNLGSSETDAMAYYQDEFEKQDMDNFVPIDRLRHLFVLLIGLGMRESSGRYCEGRDMSADNVSSDTCEAGLFQSSWNFHNASTQIDTLFMEYWDDPNGFLSTFNEKISPSASNLNCYGTGPGASYQWLAKFSPAFAVMSTAIGLRVIRKHWGPINRMEVDIVPEADELLQRVQEIVEEPNVA